MQGIYRDGLSQPRRRAEAQAALALERAAHISGALRRQLPRKLRVELKQLEAQLGERVECVADVEQLEERIEQYTQLLAIAETMAAQLPAHNAARRRRRALSLLAALLLAIPFAILISWRAHDIFAYCGRPSVPPSPNFAALFLQSAPVCVYTENYQCDWLCQGQGLCEVVDGSCTAVTDRQCQRSSACKNSGRCTAFEGRCIAASDDDCAGSELCEHLGLCHVQLDEPIHPYGDPYGECIARLDDDCAASDACADDNLCFAQLGGCVASGGSRCARTSACLLEGLCRDSADGGCVALSNDDCGFSEACLMYGRCSAHDGRCMALSDWGCLDAEDCQRERSPMVGLR